MLAQIKEKSADSDDSKSGLFAAKAGDKTPVKATAPAKAEPAAADVAVALKAVSAKSVDALMAEAKATGGVAEALAAAKAEVPTLAGKSPERTTKMLPPAKPCGRSKRAKPISCRFRHGGRSLAKACATNHQDIHKCH